MYSTHQNFKSQRVTTFMVEFGPERKRGGGYVTCSPVLSVSLTLPVMSQELTALKGLPESEGTELDFLYAPL